jgi:hypothetical protein
MNAVHHMTFGRWAPRILPDVRVSWHEQQDFQIPVGPPAPWDVVLLCLGSFVVIWPVAVIAIALRNCQ